MSLIVDQKKPTSLPLQVGHGILKGGYNGSLNPVVKFAEYVLRPDKFTETFDRIIFLANHPCLVGSRVARTFSERPVEELTKLIVTFGTAKAISILASMVMEALKEKQATPSVNGAANPSVNKAANPSDNSAANPSDNSAANLSANVFSNVDPEILLAGLDHMTSYFINGYGLGVDETTYLRKVLELENFAWCILGAEARPLISELKHQSHKMLARVNRMFRPKPIGSRWSRENKVKIIVKIIKEKCIKAITQKNLSLEPKAPTPSINQTTAAPSTTPSIVQAVAVPVLSQSPYNMVTFGLSTTAGKVLAALPYVAVAFSIAETVAEAVDTAKAEELQLILEKTRIAIQLKESVQAEKAAREKEVRIEANKIKSEQALREAANQFQIAKREASLKVCAEATQKAKEAAQEASEAIKSTYSVSASVSAATAISDETVAREIKDSIELAEAAIGALKLSKNALEASLHAATLQNIMPLSGGKLREVNEKIGFFEAELAAKKALLGSGK